MTPLRFIFYFIAFAAILAVCAKIHGELPEGMHLTNMVYFIPCEPVRNDSLELTKTIRFDTVVFRQVPTWALDSLDSVWLEQSRREAFDKRRGKSDSK